MAYQLVSCLTASTWPERERNTILAGRNTMSLTDDAYSRLSQEERDKYDSEVLAKEKLEQEALPYKWTQTLDHVEMMIPVPSGTRSKQVQLTLKRTSISVTVHGSIIVEVGIHVYLHAGCIA